MTHTHARVLLLLMTIAFGAVACGPPAPRAVPERQPTQVPEYLRWTPPMPEV